jgi:hypothetical protein
MDSGEVPKPPMLSVTLKVTVTGPPVAIVGVPDMTPVVVLKDNPAGKVPVTIAHDV